MLSVKNVKLDRTLSLRGQPIGPGETALVDVSQADAKKNLFVRLGYLHVEGASGGSEPQANKGPSAKEVVEQIAEMDDIEALRQYVGDSRKTVDEAARTRIQALTDQVVEQIAESEDTEWLNGMAEDDREAVANAALERLEALEATE